MPKSAFIERISKHLDQMDRERLRGYIQRLTREVAFLETVFDTLQEGVIVVNQRLRVRYVNHAASALLGLPEDAVGQPVARFLKDLDWQRSLSEDAPRRVVRQDLEIIYPHRRILTVYLMPQPGERHSSIVVLHDVTESRHQARTRLEDEKLQMMSLLAAGVAHEIGNPLNSLLIHLQLLQRRCAASDDAETREMLDLAGDEANRLHQILAQFLDAIRAVKPSLVPLLLPPLVEDTMRLLEREIRDREITVNIVWPDEMPTVHGDAGQLRQAFYNLLRNALQAMPGGGVLTVSGQVEDDYVSLTFADTGVGISPADIGRIFEPYFTTRSSGSGLGLMVVERIIRENGGQLTVDSSPGQGATFRIRLPRTSRRIRLLPPPADLAPDTAADPLPSPAQRPATARRRRRTTNAPPEHEQPWKPRT